MTTTLEQFTDVTVTVVSEDGMADYVPMLMIPKLKTLRAIEGIPEDVDHRIAIQNSIRASGLESFEFFFGVRSGEREITTGHYTPDSLRFMKIVAADDGYLIKALDHCDWWQLQPVAASIA